MKKIFLSISILGVVCLLGSCKKELLNQVNPNNPTPNGTLATESGMLSYAGGLLQRSIYNVPNSGNSNIFAIAQTTQSILGDETFIPYGNFGWRWVDQVYKITLPSSTVITNPFGVTQQASLEGFNSRQAADRNAFFYEWASCYLFINQANTILEWVDKTSFTGNIANKKATIKAWAYWWKGLAYSRIGSTYLGGLIYNSTSGVVNNFVDHNAIITEANANFDLCATQLTGIADSDADYADIMNTIVLSFNDAAHLVKPTMWKRGINSYKARNLLVNKKSSAMTAADWTAIISLVNDGLKPSDNYFKFGSTSDGNNDLSSSWMHPLMFSSPNTQYEFVSERLVQDYKTGDARFTRDILQLPYPPAKDATYGLSAFSNIRSRGLQFGTRWAFVPFEDGGTLTENAIGAFYPFGCTYEENALMLAEANINTGQIETGLGYIDDVRNYQGATLPAVKGTGLTLAQAKEELRKERRIGLAVRGLAFFDARRWGVTAPAASGGGRTGAIVYVPKAIAGTAVDTPLPCFMEYNYMDYWDVPQNELDFNTPAAGSATVLNSSL